MVAPWLPRSSDSVRLAPTTARALGLDGPEAPGRVTVAVHAWRLTDGPAPVRAGFVAGPAAWVDLVVGVVEVVDETLHEGDGNAAHPDRLAGAVRREVSAWVSDFLADRADCPETPEAGGEAEGRLFLRAAEIADGLIAAVLGQPDAPRGSLLVPT